MNLSYAGMKEGGFATTLVLNFKGCGYRIKIDAKVTEHIQDYCGSSGLIKSFHSDNLPNFVKFEIFNGEYWYSRTVFLKVRYYHQVYLPIITGGSPYLSSSFSDLEK